MCICSCKVTVTEVFVFASYDPARLLISLGADMAAVDSKRNTGTQTITLVNVVVSDLVVLMTVLNLTHNKRVT